jgi:uncharacterized membrane protein
MNVTHLDEDPTPEFIFDLLKSTDKVEKNKAHINQRLPVMNICLKKTFNICFIVLCLNIVFLVCKFLWSVHRTIKNFL